MNRSTQGGLTLTHFLLACVGIGFFALLVMRLFPLYSESYKVTYSMEAVAERADIAGMGTEEVTNFLLKNLQISYVDRFNEQNIRSYLKIKPDKGGKTRTMTLSYENRGNMFGDLDVVLKYNNSVTLPGNGIE